MDRMFGRARSSVLLSVALAATLVIAAPALAQQPVADQRRARPSAPPSGGDRHPGARDFRHDRDWTSRQRNYGWRDDWRRPDWRYHTDRDRWRGGYWHHGYRNGLLAWWWILGNDWYAYSAPVYPYPEPYAPPPAVTGLNYYYCYDPPGYYPEVGECPSGWVAVPPN